MSTEVTPKPAGIIIVEPIGAIFSSFQEVVDAVYTPAGPGNPFNGHTLTIAEQLPDGTWRTTWYATT